MLSLILSLFSMLDLNSYEAEISMTPSIFLMKLLLAILSSFLSVMSVALFLKTGCPTWFTDSVALPLSFSFCWDISLRSCLVSLVYSVIPLKKFLLSLIAAGVYENLDGALVLMLYLSSKNNVDCSTSSGILKP